MGNQLQKVIKVQSHCDPAATEDPLAEWAFRGNSAVDALVSNEYLQHPDHLAVWKALTLELQTLCTVREHVHATLLKVGKQAILQQRTTPSTDAPARSPRLRQEDIHETCIQRGPLECLPSRYRFPGFEAIFEWLFQLIDLQSEIRLVSCFQLNAIFELQGMSPGVRYITSSKKWISREGTAPQDFVARSNALSRYLQATIAELGGTCRPLHLRSSSGIITFWTQCLAVRVRNDWWDASEAFLGDNQQRINSVGAMRGVK